MCVSWRQEVGDNGGSDVFGSDDKWRWKEIRRIGNAARVIGVLNELVWKCKELNYRRTELKVYNTIAVPTLMYGSETWVLLNKQQ